MWPQTALTFSASSHQVDWHNTEPAFVDRITMSVYVDRAQMKGNKGGFGGNDRYSVKKRKKMVSSDTDQYLWSWSLDWVWQESDHQTCVGRESVRHGCEAQLALTAAFRSSGLLSLVSHQPLSNMLHITYTVTSTAVPWTVKALACSVDTLRRCKVHLYKEATHLLAPTDRFWVKSHEQELSWHSRPGKTSGGMSREKEQKKSSTCSSRLGVESEARNVPL